MGLQGGFTKFPCYLCHWDSRGITAHYHRRIWPKRTEFFVGKSNIKWGPLIDPSKIHVIDATVAHKIGPYQTICLIVRQEIRRFSILTKFFPKISEAKIKADVFFGQQIKNP